MNIFGTYLLVYTFLTLFYVFYRYAFLIKAITEENKQYNYSGSFSVVVPFYNEEPELLKRTIESIWKAKGNKEIIVIDDGSTYLDCDEMLRELSEKINFKHLRYAPNKGKRHAQALGFKYAKEDIIITVDSDTLFDENAFIELIKPFSEDSIGATTGNLEILNKDDNLLTRIVNARYWSAFNFERQSQSSFCGIICCTGPLSAYRRNVLKEVLKDYSNQEFLGKECTYGDDRHLTSLFIKRGYKVLFCPRSIGYTASPSTFKGFLKQQTRWKKSWLRENWLMSKYIWKQDRKIAFELFLTTGIVFFSLPLRIIFLIMVFSSWTYILSILPLFTFIILLQNTYMIIHKPKYLIYAWIYAWFYVFVLYWLLYYALFTLKDTGWGTR